MRKVERKGLPVYSSQHLLDGPHRRTIKDIVQSETKADSGEWCFYLEFEQEGDIGFLKEIRYLRVNSYVQADLNKLFSNTDGELRSEDLIGKQIFLKASSADPWVHVVPEEQFVDYPSPLRTIYHDIEDAAREYMGENFSPFFCVISGKTPKYSRWNKQYLSADAASRWMQRSGKDRKIGLAPGKIGLAAIDCDPRIFGKDGRERKDATIGELEAEGAHIVEIVREHLDQQNVEPLAEIDSTSPGSCHIYVRAAKGDSTVEGHPDAWSHGEIRSRDVFQIAIHNPSEFLEVVRSVTEEESEVDFLNGETFDLYLFAGVNPPGKRVGEGGGSSGYGSLPFDNEDEFYEAISRKDWEGAPRHPSVQPTIRRFCELFGFAKIDWKRLKKSLLEGEYGSCGKYTEKDIDLHFAWSKKNLKNVGPIEYTGGSRSPAFSNKPVRFPSVGRKSLTEFIRACDDMRWRWRMNTLSDSLEVSWPQDPEFHIPGAYEEAEMMSEFAERVEVATKNGPSAWVITQTQWRQFTRGAGHKNRVNPFKDWVENDCTETSGGPSLDRLFIDGLGAADTQLNREIGRLFMIAAVRRAIVDKRSTKFDLCPIIIGPQGTAKTEFLKFLFPESEGRRDSWITDSMSLFIKEDANFYRSFSGRVIAISDEVVGNSKPRLAMAKARITRYTDNYRDLYFDKETPRPRKCVFASTANDLGAGVIPADPSGYRRWVPILVPPPPQDDIDAPYRKAVTWAREHREHLWALALREAREGSREDLRLSALARRMQEKVSRKNAYDTNVLFTAWVRNVLVPKIIEREDLFLELYSSDDQGDRANAENMIEDGLVHNFKGRGLKGLFALEDEIYDKETGKSLHAYFPNRSNDIADTFETVGFFKKVHGRFGSARGNRWRATTKTRELYNAIKREEDRVIQNEESDDLDGDVLAFPGERA